MRRIIIITDLDGTLLHPRTYSFKEAQPALHLIRKMGIPLIFCSSKTRAEIEIYRKRLRNSHPFVTENGGGIFIPLNYFSFPVEGRVNGNYQQIQLGRPYQEVREKFVSLRDHMGIRVKGFGDMQVNEIVKLTGLSESEATLARQRDYDEPFIFPGSREDRFLQAISTIHLRWTAGRLFHILGDHDKGKAVTILKELYQRECGELHVIGLGDSFNDLPMLEKVDQPVLICHEDGTYEERIMIPALLRSVHCGDSGWNEAVHSLLTEIAAPEYNINKL
jgi:mannosyl-3-phosphoglycerate phosphatase